MSKTWGYSLLMNAAGCKRELQTYENIYAFAKELVKEIDMVAYGEPQIVHFGTDDKAGYTLVQLIETSNICAHFVELNEEIYLDVFSCKYFEDDVVFRVFDKYFKPITYTSRVVDRRAPNGNEDF
jgi:S-adenosylmethionine decarboxylase